MRFLIVLVVLCGSFVSIAGMMDFYIGGGVLRQALAMTYPSAEGVVTHSAVAAVPPVNGRSTFYRPDVRYAYTVRGEVHEGRVLRYTEPESTLPANIASIIRAYPIGASVAVRYNVGRPSDAILEPGLHGNDLFQLMMIVPFNIGAAFLLYVVWAMSPLPMPQQRFAPTGARTMEDGDITRVRFAFYRPILSGALTFTFATFAALLIAAWLSLSASLWLMLMDWAVLLGVSGWMYWRQWRKQEGGGADLVIDRTRKTVELPAHFGRKEREVWAFADVKEIQVETIERRHSRGGRSWTDEVRLVRQDGRRELIEELGDRARADAFAHWLRAQLIA